MDKKLDEIKDSRQTPESISSQGELFKTYQDLQEENLLLNLKKRNCEEQLLASKIALQRTLEKIERIKSVPLILGQVLEIIDDRTAIVASMAGLSNVVRILSTVNKEELRPNVTVALNKHSLAIVSIVPSDGDGAVPLMNAAEKPSVLYSEIGGLETQKVEIRETVELPLQRHALYKQIGIDPPKGVLLYGPPGTGKTLLVKAVATATNAAFIRVSGSEFIQKYLGEGPRKVRETFRLAKEMAPSIVFIDEVDAVATTRFDSATSADREVQRVLIELLTQMDGFDQNENVKVIMATNRIDTLDPALLRPGRLDRKIEFPLPDRKQKRLIFNAITSKMSLGNEVDLEHFVSRADGLCGADIHSICQEAGMLAVRGGRYVVSMADFEIAYSKVLGNKGTDLLFYK